MSKYLEVKTGRWEDNGDPTTPAWLHGSIMERHSALAVVMIDAQHSGTADEIRNLRSDAIGMGFRLSRSCGGAGANGSPQPSSGRSFQRHPRRTGRLQPRRHKILQRCHPRHVPRFGLSSGSPGKAQKGLPEGSGRPRRVNRIKPNDCFDAASRVCLSSFCWGPFPDVRRRPMQNLFQNNRAV